VRVPVCVFVRVRVCVCVCVQAVYGTIAVDHGFQSLRELIHDPVDLGVVHPLVSEIVVNSPRFEILTLVCVCVCEYVPVSVVCLCLCVLVYVCVCVLV